MRLTAGVTTTKMAEFASVRTRKTYENWEKEGSKASPDMNQFYRMLCGCGYDARTAFELLSQRGASDKKAINWRLALSPSNGQQE